MRDNRPRAGRKGDIGRDGVRTLPPSRSRFREQRGVRRKAAMRAYTRAEVREAENDQGIRSAKAYKTRVGLVGSDPMAACA
jgi:hypothetical protein